MHKINGNTVTVVSSKGKGYTWETTSEL